MQILCINSSSVFSRQACLAASEVFVCLLPLALVQGSLWHSQTERDSSLSHHSWIHLLWEAGSDSMSPMLSFSLWKTLSPQWLFVGKILLSLWLNKRLILCHVKSCYNDFHGANRKCTLEGALFKCIDSIGSITHTHFPSFNFMSLYLKLICVCAKAACLCLFDHFNGYHQLDYWFK